MLPPYIRPMYADITTAILMAKKRAFRNPTWTIAVVVRHTQVGARYYVAHPAALYSCPDDAIVHKIEPALPTKGAKNSLWKRSRW